MRFEACAHTYEAHATPQLSFAVRVAGFIDARPGERIVEFGAGTGALTRHLAGRQARWIQATDISPAMIRLGRERAPAAHWSVLDAFADRPPEATLQVSSGLLQWAENPVQVLSAWKEALAPKGRMVHAFPCEPCLQEWRRLVPQSPIQWRTDAAWRSLFAQAKLHVLRHTLWIEVAHFSSSLEMLRALHRSGVTGPTRLGSGRLRQALRRYESLHRETNGVAATWAWLALEACQAETLPLGTENLTTPEVM